MSDTETVARLQIPEVNSNYEIPLKKGQIVVFYGALDSGIREVLRDCAGLNPEPKYKVWKNGRWNAYRSPRSALRDGITIITDDRLREGLILDLSIADNINLRMLSMDGQAIVRNAMKEFAKAKQVCDDFLISAVIHQQVGSLSGGTQQKVLFAGVSQTKSEVLILHEPTRGVDIGAKVDIYHTIKRLASSGRAVVVGTSDVEEALRVGTTIVVLNRRKMTGVFLRDNTNKQLLLSLATGS
jgi:ABC-type sugar transport system ATPase subunit